MLKNNYEREHYTEFCQFASKKWNLHSSPKDHGHTDVKYFILR